MKLLINWWPGIIPRGPDKAYSGKEKHRTQHAVNNQDLHLPFRTACINEERSKINEGCNSKYCQNNSKSAFNIHKPLLREIMQIGCQL